MGNYTVIADIGNLMVRLMREHMVPEIIASADTIGLCSPSERENISLGLYLYDIRESEIVRVNGMVSHGVYRQKYPPVYVDLYYMVTAWSMSEEKFRASEEQRILGRVIQLFHDHPTLYPDSMSFEPSSSGEPVKIEIQAVDAADKIKLWSEPDTPYRLSLFYKVSPVMIESSRSEKISRVTSMDFSVDEQK